MKEITYHESLQVENALYIDVRSPFEFGIDHIPNAVNIPLFSDEERIEVGTLYRMIGRDEAVFRGTEIVGEKLRKMIEEFNEYKNKNIIIYCARGGMRSLSVASLLSSLGMTVFRIIRGYKGYRRHVNESLASLTITTPLIVLQGLTGTGKTEILHMMENTIDLEGMAGHRSSIFGGIGLSQSSQKYFESQLLQRIHDLKTAPYIIIEGESQKIGNLHIPDTFFRIMRNSKAVLINTDMERRIDIITGEYAHYSNARVINDIVMTLTTKLGSKNVDLLISLYREGNIREFTRLLLEKYYDPRYVHSMNRMSYIGTVDNMDTHSAARAVEKLVRDYLGMNRGL